MPLKDAPTIDREAFFQKSKGELIGMIQDLTNKAYHNRQLFEFACNDHVDDFRSVELELARAGIPYDDDYGCYPIAERVRMLAKQLATARQAVWEEAAKLVEEYKSIGGTTSPGQATVCKIAARCREQAKKVNLPI